MKILHSADWHLDAPMAGDTDLQQALLQVPGMIADLCRAEGCALMLLSGDLFDGKASPESIAACKRAFAQAGVPVLISPGNHDYISPTSPWVTGTWPENVHVFTTQAIESLPLPELDCRIYGAGFTGMDCPPLMEDFRTSGEEAWHIAVLHGDPTQKNSPYNPITQAQIGASGLNLLALGHIHKEGAQRSKGTLCLWPGCPMGRGFDELEEKGVYIIELGSKTEYRFVPLDTPRFHDYRAEILTDPATALEQVLPAAGNRDYYRIRLTGESETPDLASLQARFPQFPHLELRDETVPVADLWGAVGQDSLEGVYFGKLKDAMDGADPETRETLLLAAKISRKLLDGREVKL